MKNEIRTKLDLLARRIIESNHLPKAKNSWIGGEVRIVNSEADIPDTSGTYSYKMPVITKYNLELSFLFQNLRDIFYNANLVDGGNKYDFFRRLGNAANRLIELSDNHYTASDLLLSVLREAYDILDEFEKDEFMHMEFTFNNAVADDFTSDKERKGFTSLIEMNQFYDKRNINLRSGL